jgi:ABC-2 type transport system ATP-binding protein
MVVQDELSQLTKPTQNTVITTPDVDDAVTVLGPRVVRRTGEVLLVAGSDPAELNATLVAKGIRVTELNPERRTLEEVVLELTSVRTEVGNPR